jgi:hypothetical protein
MKQSFAVLESWKNNAASADIRQGYIFAELLRLMAEANDGMILPILSVDNKQTYMRLTKQNLARNYAIRVIERPMTRDEKQDAFNKLMQLAPNMMAAGVNLYPVIARLAPLDKELRDEMQKLATPTVPQADPAAQAMQQATIDYTNAQAQKAIAEAKRIESEIPMKQEQTLADIDETQAKTAKVVGEIAMAEQQQSAALIERILAQVQPMPNNTFNI